MKPVTVIGTGAALTGVGIASTMMPVAIGASATVAAESGALVVGTANSVSVIMIAPIVSKALIIGGIGLLAYGFFKGFKQGFMEEMNKART